MCLASLSTITSVLALLCSISIAFVLFVSQANRTERVAAYDAFKVRLLETQQWLLTKEKSKDRETCLSLVFELDKLDITDLPTTDRGNEYRHYTAALKSGLNDNRAGRRPLLLESVAYFGYLDHLLDRIGVVAIGQIISRGFIHTLAKGAGVTCLGIIGLLAATLCYGNTTRLVVVLLIIFCGVASILLLYEICATLYRYDDEQLDFIEQEPKETSADNGFQENDSGLS